jgi:hypothetical protein
MVELKKKFNRLVTFPRNLENGNNPMLQRHFQINSFDHWRFFFLAPNS